MSHPFLSLPEAEQKQAYEIATRSLNIDQIILEKDFWVSWLLGLLFSLPKTAPHLVFKGGTSLSKVFGVIDRFSEDIDLCLVPEFVGADAAGFDALTSRTRRDAAIMEMQALCSAKAQAVLMPELEAAIAGALGKSASGAWLRYELDADAKSPIVYFAYPSLQGGGFAYLKREVKLELGTLTDQQPTGRYPVKPLLADAFPKLFDGWVCEVTALELERTFWEKATILHAEFHRPEHLPTPSRYARHYFDMAKLLGHPQAAQYLADQTQCARVVSWKSRVFARSWARYDLAQPGSFRLAPPAQREADLALDYRIMRPMFMSEPPPFDEILAQLRQAEATLNA
jgi:Nucleotidyl transferase AbiEii toxin, Type IV TA system